MSGYFPARRAYSVSTRTGIVYIAGEEQPRKASHDKTEPRPPCLLRYGTRLVRSCTRLVRSSWELASKPKNFGHKKTARHAKRHSGRSFREAEACDARPLLYIPEQARRDRIATPCGNARATEHQTNALSFHTHQLGTLVVSNPDLLGSIVSDAEVEAFKEI